MTRQLWEGMKGAGPKGWTVEGGPRVSWGRGSTGCCFKGAQDATEVEMLSWPRGPRTGGPASARGCHGDGRRAGAAWKRGQRSASLRLRGSELSYSAGLAFASPVADSRMGSHNRNPSARAQGLGPRATAPH